MVSRIPNDIFQFSTVSALMAGLCTSGPLAHQLTGYGTHGLGTCSALNGEVLFLDSVAYHITTSPSKKSSSQSMTQGAADDQEALNDAARGLDPVIKKAARDAMMPFVQVTLFRPEFRLPLPLPQSKTLSKSSLLNTLSSPPRSPGGPLPPADLKGTTGGQNSFLPFLIRGTFADMTIRIGGPIKDDSESLAQVTARAPQWRIKGAKGTIFGFLSPAWSNGISVAGFHGHFIEDEGQGARRGGHVLDFVVGEGEGRVEWGVSGHHHLGLPRGEEWESLELGVDAEGIAKAEG
ncbi:Uu.00g121780.m01.CDS01 [Anthostomella pinea]|uniref:Alpha-acetolactate decarboxylase n=1 Tax=Anthostomella pinea TaxID=933095 RepID=A0AAI8YHC0_9PEZI|nr:Uu.00g121780.m01.CDS01 [Anthostomella pinea]